MSALIILSQVFHNAFFRFASQNIFFTNHVHLSVHPNPAHYFSYTFLLFFCLFFLIDVFLFSFGVDLVFPSSFPVFRSLSFWTMTSVRQNVKSCLRTEMKDLQPPTHHSTHTPMTAPQKGEASSHNQNRNVSKGCRTAC